MLYVGTAMVLVLSIVIGILLKTMVPRVTLLFWIILSLTILLLVVAALIRANQPDL